MSTHTIIRDLLIACLILTLPAHALAGPGKGKGNKARGQTQSSADHGTPLVEVDIRIGSDARSEIRDYYASRSHCPPGLAKKQNGCLPPGQAKKRYRVGGVLPQDLWNSQPPEDLRRRLPPPPDGHIYSHVDGDVLLVAEATHRVVDAVVAVDAAIKALKH